MCAPGLIGWIGWFGLWVCARADLPGWIGWIGWFGPRVCACGTPELDWLDWMVWFLGVWVCGSGFCGRGVGGGAHQKNPAKKAFSWQGFFL